MNKIDDMIGKALTEEDRALLASHALGGGLGAGRGARAGFPRGHGADPGSSTGPTLRPQALKQRDQQAPSRGRCALPC